jgi:hypothetical protein
MILRVTARKRLWYSLTRCASSSVSARPSAALLRRREATYALHDSALQQRAAYAREGSRAGEGSHLYAQLV